MKKVLRYVALFLTVALLALSLCGCGALDEMRKYHAISTENGDILLDGITYKPLPYHEALTCNWDSMGINLTAPDVPLLLSEMLAESTLWLSDNRVLIFDADTEVYYCNEESYESLAQQIKEGPAYVGYSYSYNYWDEDLYEYVSKDCVFTADQVEVMDSILVTVKPVGMDGMQYLASFEEMADIYRHSADGYFNELICSIARSNDTYFLKMIVDNDTVAVYRIPDAYKNTIIDILQDYLTYMY